jgi:uncharacterized membrane protein SpoIIM required for sporulation
LPARYAGTLEGGIYSANIKKDAGGMNSALQRTSFAGLFMLAPPVTPPLPVRYAGTLEGGIYSANIKKDAGGMNSALQRTSRSAGSRLF